MRGMLQTPEDRTEPVPRLFEGLGAKLIGWYMTSGEYDWLLIVEAPSQDVVVSAATPTRNTRSSESIFPGVTKGGSTLRGAHPQIPFSSAC